MNLSWLRGALPPVQKLWDRFRYVLLVLAAGVLLLLLPLDGGGEGREAPAQEALQEALQEAFSLEEFEEKLSDTLSQIQGAGEVRAVLSLKGGSRQVLAQDTQRGADGDASAATVTLSQGGGSQTVVPLQTLAPQFQGALVVCPGGNDPEVRLRITRAVSALTGLGSDRISVCPGG